MMLLLHATLYVFLAFWTNSVVTKHNSIKEQRIWGKLGGEANLTCDGMADYNNSVLLFNNTSIVEKPGKFQKLPNGAMKILDIQPLDTGSYKYKQSSGDLTHINYCIITLEINEEEVIVKPWSTVTMSCEVTAPMEMWDQVLWRRKYSSETKTIVSNGSVSEFAKQAFSGRLSTSGKKLVIRDSERGDSGRYICTVAFKDPHTPRANYYINLVVSTPSTTKPISKEPIGKSSTSTPVTKAPKRKSRASGLAVYLPLGQVAVVTFLLSIFV